MQKESQGHILVVDDEPQVRELLANILREEGYKVTTSPNADDARQRLDELALDLVFTDLRMPGASGIEVLRHIREHELPTMAVVMTAYRSLDDAVEAFRLHAFDFITKPLEIEEVKRLARTALEIRSRHVVHEDIVGPNGSPPAIRRRESGRKRPLALVGHTAIMRRLHEQIAIIASSSSTVLIRGESGTGKELVAQALHHNSPRANRPLIPVNCGAIPEDLLESELFGHVRGAFTGAMNDRVGRFVLANGGTIFLDEIGDMSPKLQVKILRVLQEQEIEPVGSAETIRVDVRVLAATNMNLEKAVEERRFREDLYYRLNVIPVHIPPLRERVDDLPLLIEHFIRRFNKVQPRQIDAFSPGTLDVLQRYPWPGNVRELENLVERMTILSKGPVVEPDDLPEKFYAGVRTNNPLSAVPHFPADRSGGMNDTQMRILMGVSPTDSRPDFSAVTEPIRVARESVGLTPEERYSIAGHGKPFETPAVASPNAGHLGGSIRPDAIATASTGSSAPPLNALLEGPLINDNGVDLNQLVNRFERNLILEALERCRGVRSRAAGMLGIKRTTLVEKMKKMDILFDRK